MYRSGSGKETRKHERISYECRIKMERQNLACKGFCLFFLFCKNANDSEMERSGIELNGCMALIAYAGISVSQIYLGKHCSFCFRRSEASC